MGDKENGTPVPPGAPPRPKQCRFYINVVSATASSEIRRYRHTPVEFYFWGQPRDGQIGQPLQAVRTPEYHLTTNETLLFQPQPDGVQVYNSQQNGDIVACGGQVDHILNVTLTDIGIFGKSHEAQISVKCPCDGKVHKKLGLIEVDRDHVVWRDQAGNLHMKITPHYVSLDYVVKTEC